MKLSQETGITSCQSVSIRKKNCSSFERINYSMILTSHQTNQIRNLVVFVDFFHYTWSKIKFLGYLFSFNEVLYKEYSSQAKIAHYIFI